MVTSISFRSRRWLLLKMRVILCESLPNLAFSAHYYALHESVFDRPIIVTPMSVRQSICPSISERSLLSNCGFQSNVDFLFCELPVYLFHILGVLRMRPYIFFKTETWNLAAWRRRYRDPDMPLDLDLYIFQLEMTSIPEFCSFKNVSLINWHIEK